MIRAIRSIAVAIFIILSISQISLVNSQSCVIQRNLTGPNIVCPDVIYSYGVWRNLFDYPLLPSIQGGIIDTFLTWNINISGAYTDTIKVIWNANPGPKSVTWNGYYYHNGNTCTYTSTVFVNLFSTINISASSYSVLCPSSTVTLTAPPGYLSYLWNTSSNNSSIVVNTPGTYSVTISNIGGCTAVDSQLVVNFGSCLTPLSLYANNIGAHTATLHWSAVPCANKYRVQYRKLGSQTWTTLIIYAPSTAVTLYNLQNNHTYQWQVMTMCSGSGNSPFSSVQYFTTPILKTDSDVPIENSDSEIAIYPNPNDGIFKLNFSVEDNIKAQINIFDAFGKLIHSENKSAFNGINYWDINLSQIANGIYIMQLNLKGELYLERFIINR